MGGLSKKAYQLELLRKKTIDPIVLLDGGALLFKYSNIPTTKLSQAKITAVGIVDAYNAMNFSAVGIAEQDLAGGIDFLQEMAAQAKFDWLSANLVDKTDGTALFTPATIISAGKIKLAVLGITDESAQKKLNKTSKAKIIPWHEVLPSLVEKYQNQADLIVLISSYTVEENKKISDSLPKINLILNSGRRPRNLTPVLHKNTLLIQAASKGKYYGILDIYWHSSHIWQASSAPAYDALKRKLTGVKEQVQKFEQKEQESAYLTKNMGAKRAYDFMLESIPSMDQELIDLENKLKKETGRDKTASMYKNQFVALKKVMPDEPKVLTIVNEIKKNIRLDGKRQKTLRAEFKPFVGWLSCAKCHKKQTKAWLQSRHSRSLSSLTKNNQEKNRDCIACHVTGLITGEEPNALSLPAKLLQVGCESCHGPGEMHLDNPKQWPMTEKPAAKTCLRCHDPEHDDSFVFQEKIKRLGCPKTED